MSTKFVIGHIINIGVTSCRLFEILKDRTLKESKVISYDINDPHDKDYLSGIINLVKKEIFPDLQKSTPLFKKVFVDACFSDVFTDEGKREKFVMDFYRETNLYFNILTHNQTKQNMIRLFDNITNGTIVVNIGSRYVDLYEYNDDKFTIHNLPISLDDITMFLDKRDISEIWNENTIDLIKAYINGKIESRLHDVNVEMAIIIKDEETFMRQMGYPLKQQNGGLWLTIDEYKKANRDVMFTVDYAQMLEEEFNDSSIVKRLYGFKNGHIILESIFDYLHVEKIKPSNQLSIHGSINAYIFNVVLSGSVNNGRDIYMKEAHKLMESMNANVSSPVFQNNKLLKITDETEYGHLCRIRDCDLLFICNKEDGYIGRHTYGEIYYAFALHKTIAFWKEPEDVDRLAFIPHEQWEQIQSLVEKE